MKKCSRNQPNPLKEPSMLSKMKLIIAGIVAFISLIVLIICWNGLIGSNDDQNWQVKQNLSGSVEIIDKPGLYPMLFPTVWTYPRSIQTFYSAAGEDGQTEDDSISVTFNDGGTADINAMVRFNLPVTAEHRRKLHQNFSGSQRAIEQAVRAHLVNCLKNTAPIMSASENQSGRKSEFNQLVEEQLRNGLYLMRVVTKVQKDETDESGEAITVYSTEIVKDPNGVARIGQNSPLKEFGIEISQFSITGTQYDEKTQEQFAAKKTAFLAAERSKAEREQEVQQRLMIQEKGLREKAEVEAEANKVKVKATTEAQQKVEVAEKTKEEAETKANQLLEVAKIEKQQALTVASQELEVATIQAQAAQKRAEAIKALAEAEAEKIKLGGAISERDRILAEIAAKRDIEVALNLSKIHSPSVVFNGGGGTGQGSSWNENLINMIFLRAAGIDFDKLNRPAISETVK